MSVGMPGEIILGYHYPKPPPAPIPDGIAIKQGPWQIVQDCLEIHEVAKLRGVCRTWRDPSTTYLNSKQTREKLKIPEGVSTTAHLAVYGTPTVESALELIKRAVAQQDLDFAHAYRIEMPLDPGCSIWATFGPEDPIASTMPKKYVATSRKRVANQNRYYTRAMVNSSLLQLNNKIRAFAGGMEPITPEETERRLMPYEKQCRPGAARIAYKAILPPFAGIPDAFLQQLNALRVQPNNVEEGEEIDVLIRQLEPFMSSDDHCALNSCVAGVREYIHRFLNYQERSINFKNLAAGLRERLEAAPLLDVAEAPDDIEVGTPIALLIGLLLIGGCLDLRDFAVLLIGLFFGAHLARI
ncbi:MAG TPA: hypothetical protein VLF94_00895 [Chlamydiales bacterium]|nr:hypothetical protein [Chlamydiales bacterium]